MSNAKSVGPHRTNFGQGSTISVQIAHFEYGNTTPHRFGNSLKKLIWGALAAVKNRVKHGPPFSSHMGQKTGCLVLSFSHLDACFQVTIVGSPPWYDRSPVLFAFAFSPSEYILHISGMTFPYFP